MEREKNMGLKYYLNLFKKDTNDEAVRLRYFLNVFVFLVGLVFSTAFFSLKNTDIILSSIFGALAFLTIILYRVLSRSFSSLIDKLLEDEVLDEQDEIDAAFLSYRRGYQREIEKNRKLNRKLFPISIIANVIFIGMMPAIIVLNLLGSVDLADRIFAIVSIFAFAYLLILLIASIYFGRNGVWYQGYYSELTIINKYKAKNGYSKSKYKILEDKKPKEQTKYLFGDKNLEARFVKIKRISNAFGGILGGMMGLFLVMGLSIMEMLNFSEETADLIFGIVLLCLFSLAIILPFIFSHFSEKAVKEQLALLEQNLGTFSKKAADVVSEKAADALSEKDAVVVSEKDADAFSEKDAELNRLCLQLHGIRTPFYKRWNLLFLLSFVGAIGSNALFGGIVSLILKSDSYSWIFFLLMLCEFLAIFVVYFKAFGKMRLKMIDIENEIDRIRMLG